MEINASERLPDDIEALLQRIPAELREECRTLMAEIFVNSQLLATDLRYGRVIMKQRAAFSSSAETPPEGLSHAEQLQEKYLKALGLEETEPTPPAQPEPSQV